MFARIALLFLCSSLAATPIVRIGTLMDGPSPYLEKTLETIEIEIDDLMVPEFVVEYPARAQKVADWSVEEMRLALAELLADEEVDLVITIGFLSSLVAAEERVLDKPVVAAAVLEGLLPFEGAENFAYVATPSNIERDLATFEELVGAERIAFLVDEELYSQLPASSEAIEELQETFNIELVLMGETAQGTLARIPDNVEGVYVTPPFRMKKDEVGKLYEGLAYHRLPSFSMLGEDEVKRGAMLGLAPASNLPRLGRRVALNAQRIALGETPKAIPTELTNESRLSFNQATGNLVGYSPLWKVLTGALIFGKLNAGVPFTLRDALDQALCINPEILAADQAVRAGRGEIGIARSRLLPQVELGSQARWIDSSRARESFGREPERLVRGSAGLSQQVYNERFWSEYDQQKALQCGRIADRHTVKLDVLFDVGTSYVDLLRARTLLAIEQNNLELTRRNLQLAQARVEIGTARRNELYRWESQLSSNKETVVVATARVKVTEAELNRLLHRPTLCPFATEESSLDDLMDAIGQRDLTTYIATPQSFSWFSQFEIEEGWRCSPELKKIHASIRAQSRKVKADKRAFWLPDFDFFADTEQRFVRGGAGVNPPQIPALDQAIGSRSALNDWTVGFGARFPLFEGGRKCSRLYRDRSELRELIQNWKREKDVVSLRVTRALDFALSSFLSIDLAYDAVLAARKNLAFVQDAYAQGSASILDLLDAQDTLLSSERDNADAQFNFAFDLFRLMRSVGKFDFFLSEQQRQNWFDRLSTYYQCKLGAHR